MTAPARILLLTVLASAMLASNGCIVAIGNRPQREDANRVKLAGDASTVPVIESPMELPTFEEANADALAGLSPQTTVEQFRQLFPEARFVERSSAYDVPVDAWSVTHKQTYRYDGERHYGYIRRDERWFYFQDGRFIKWGKPRDWPHSH